MSERTFMGSIVGGNLNEYYRSTVRLEGMEWRADRRSSGKYFLVKLLLADASLNLVPSKS